MTRKDSGKPSHEYREYFLCIIFFVFVLIFLFIEVQSSLNSMKHELAKKGAEIQGMSVIST